MLPAEPIIRAAVRWLRLLRTCSVTRAWAIIGADIRFVDLTLTQYGTAFEWLRSIGLIAESRGTADLSEDAKRLPERLMLQLFFERAITDSNPLWLADSDVLIRDQSDLPQDALDLAGALGLNDSTALLVIRQVHGKIDLAKIASIGAAGEEAIIQLLEKHWPGSTCHVAKENDGFGYDIVFTHSNVEWHLEVKTTTRRGRLVIHLSRPEYEVGLNDKNWRLLVVGIDSTMEIGALATVNTKRLVDTAPIDTSKNGRWHSAAFELMPDALAPGLSFIDPQALPSDKSLTGGVGYEKGAFGWLP